jgi:cysteine desulfurase / selenocysteine lyase
MLEGIKKDFPVLNQIVNDEPLVYLDNAGNDSKTFEGFGCDKRLL